MNRNPGTFSIGTIVPPLERVPECAILRDNRTPRCLAPWVPKRETSLSVTRGKRPFHPRRLLFLIKRHQTGLNPVERRFQPAGRVHPADLRFHFGWLPERSQKLIGGHPNGLGAINRL